RIMAARRGISTTDLTSASLTGTTAVLLLVNLQRTAARLLIRLASSKARTPIRAALDPDNGARDWPYRHVVQCHLWHLNEAAAVAKRRSIGCAWGNTRRAYSALRFIHECRLQRLA